jgi:Zn-dependent protease with chaperone function
MIWGLMIYIFVMMLGPAGLHPVFQHWPPLIVVAAAGAGALYLTVRRISTRASHALSRNPAKATQIQQRFRQRAAILQLMMLGGVYYFVDYLGFGRILIRSHFIIFHYWIVQFIYGTLVLGLIFLIQLGTYGFATAWRHMRDIDRLAMGRKVYPWPSSVRLALDKVRVTAGIVYTLLVFATLASYGGEYLPVWTHWQFLQQHAGVMTGIISVAILWMLYPYILVRVLNTQRMTDGQLREGLLAAARRHRIKITDIRVIQTHHRIANAAWIGTIMSPRYILLTDLVLDDFSPQEIEDIFAHELGHGHHRHATWYLLLLLAAILWLGVLAHGEEYLPGWAGAGTASATTIIFIFILISAFGRFSRLSEHQADWFAARHWAGRSAKTDTDANTGLTPPAEQDWKEAILRGAALGAEALRNLADENGLRTDRTAITHPSIDDRITSLYTLSFCPHIEKRMHQRARIWRCGILTMLVAAIACQIYIYFIR